MGHPSMMRTILCLPERTRRPGAEKMLQRSAFGSGTTPGPVETEQLEPSHQVGRERHQHHPGGVVLEAGERKAREPRVLQTADVLLDVGVGPHGDVEIPRIALLVGVEAPVAVLERGEEAALGTGVQRFTPDDQPGADRGACGPRSGW